MSALHTEEYRRLVGFLRDARLQAHLLQEELADQLGWDQTRISKIEGGRRNLDAIEFLQLVAALGLDLAEVAVAVGVPPRRSPPSR